MFSLFVVVAALANVKLVSRTFPNHLRVVLAPAIASEKVAIHVTFDAGARRDDGFPAGTASLANGVVLRRLTGFDGGVNQERAYLAVETTPEEVPRRLRRIADALASKEQLEPDVARFLRQHYGAESTAIALAGTFDQQQVMSELERTFGPMSGGALKPCVRKDPRHFADAGGAAPEMRLEYLAPQSTERDWLAMNILADIIGQGESSRLQHALVAGGLATAFGEGMTESPCGPSLLRMRVRLASRAYASRVEAVIDQETAKLRRELVSDAELALARQQELDWAKSQLSSAAGVASAAARVALFYGDPERVNTEATAMAAVTAEDVRRVARRYLRKSNRAVAITPQ